MKNLTNTRTEFTRKQYLNNDCTHREYYSQFVTDGYKNAIKSFIGLENLMQSKDKNLNDIPLNKWDNAPLTTGVNQKMLELGDYLTLAGKVCIAKEAARQIISENAI